MTETKLDPVTKSARRLEREYRPSMPTDVLHLWAGDVVKVLRVLLDRATPPASASAGEVATKERYLNFRGVGYSESAEDWRRSYQSPPATPAVAWPDQTREQLVALLRKLAKHKWTEYSDETLWGMMCEAALKAATIIEATPAVEITEDMVDLIERLETGVRPEGGMSGDIELFDIDGANSTMAEAAAALSMQFCGGEEFCHDNGCRGLPGCVVSRGKE